MQTPYREMTALERKAYDAVYRGWYMSGFYVVSFGSHTRVFRADSIRWLAGDVLDWYEKHLENHADDQICVRMLAAA